MSKRIHVEKKYMLSNLYKHSLDIRFIHVHIYCIIYIFVVGKLTQMLLDELEVLFYILDEGK